MRIYIMSTCLNIIIVTFSVRGEVATAGHALAHAEDAVRGPHHDVLDLSACQDTSEFIYLLVMTTCPLTFCHP